MDQIHGDTIWNDDIPETSDEESEENEGSMRVRLPQARLTRLVDDEEEEREYNDQMSEKLAGVPKFVLPLSHSAYIISAFGRQIQVGYSQAESDCAQVSRRLEDR